jgi:hypothetical protein
MFFLPTSKNSLKPSGIIKKGFLTGYCLIAVTVFLYGINPASGTVQAQSTTSLPLVEPMDWSVADPNDISLHDAYVPFSQDHSLHGQSLAYFLGHFHRLANAVRDEEPNKGFIDIVVWRPASENIPINGRIMDNILSMAWIYTKDEPWNPYYGDEATRLRLEQAIRFWSTLQDERGQFSTEYGRMGITMFTTKFMGETLLLLSDGPPIDTEVFELAREVTRKALLFSFNDNESWEQGLVFSNQYGNLFAGALAYLKLFDDPEVASDLRRQMLKMHEFQSAAGYLYEGEGPDWGYYFGTHHTNLQTAWEYGRDKIVDDVDLGELIRQEYELSTDWLSYNAVPDGDLFYLNRAMETRTNRMNHFRRLEIPLSEVVPLARAFHVTLEEYEGQLVTSQEKLVSEWGNPPALNQYTPYDFQFRNHKRWYPTQQQRDEAFSQLPYIARDRFNHQRMDDNATSTYTYIRRPGYYAVFNSGPILRNNQRMGLSLIWHPVAGLVFQSLSGNAGESWGTRLLGDNLLLESGRIDPALFEINSELIPSEPGIRDLPDGRMKITYGGHLPRFIDKSLTFNENNIAVSLKFVDASQRFAEQIPLMLDQKDRLTIQDNEVVFTRDDEVVFVISFTGAEQIILSGGQQEGHLRRYWVMATGTGAMDYTIQFDSEPTSALQEPDQVPMKTVLHPNYPNPFNPSTNIEFSLPVSSHVVLEVFTIQGQRVARLVNGNLEAGIHSVSFDASSLGSGVYLYRIQAGDFVRVNKMMLIK